MKDDGPSPVYLTRAFSYHGCLFRFAAALLLPGEGLHGGGALPEETDEKAGAQWRQEVSAAPRALGEPSPDPLVRRCNRDIRPAYYVEEFARAASRLLIGDVTDEPAWLAVAREHGSVQPAPSDAANAVRALAAE